MTELSALNVRIYGDSKDLQADLTRAKGALSAFETQAEKAGIAANRAGGARGAGGLSSGLGRLSNVSGQARGQIQNVSYQLQDMVVQLQMGTRWTTVMAQQVPQLAGGFGALGAALGIVAAVGFAALGVALSNTSGAVKTLDEAIDDLSTAMDAYAGYVKAANAPMTKLIEDFGEGAKRAQSLYTALASLAELEALGALSASLASANEELSGIADRLAIINSPSAQGATGELVLLRQVRALKDEFGLTVEQAEEVSAAMDRLGQAQGAYAQAQAARQLAMALMDARDESGNIPPQIASVARGLLQAAIEGEKLKGPLDRAQDAAQELAESAPKSGWMGAAITETNLLIGRLIAAKEAADAVSNAQSTFDRGNKTYSGRGGDPRQFSNPQNNTFGGTRYNVPSAGGGGGVNPLVGDLETLQQDLATQSEVINEWYATGLETLRRAREQELIVDEEYRDMRERLEREHQERMSQIHEGGENARLSAIKGAFGDAASLMQSGSKKLFEIGKAASIASAIVSGWEAATDAWAKGMKVGGPPVAAAFTAASLARTGAMISSISRQTIGGGASGSGGAGGGAASAPQAPAQQPLDVLLNTYGPGDFIRSADFGMMLDRLNETAGDRGYRLMMGT